MLNVLDCPRGTVDGHRDVQGPHDVELSPVSSEGLDALCSPAVKCQLEEEHWPICLPWSMLPGAPAPDSSLQTPLWASQEVRGAARETRRGVTVPSVQAYGKFRTALLLGLARRGPQVCLQWWRLCFAS